MNQSPPMRDLDLWDGDHVLRDAVGAPRTDIADSAGAVGRVRVRDRSRLANARRLELRTHDL